MIGWWSGDQTGFLCKPGCVLEVNTHTPALSSWFAGDTVISGGQPNPCAAGRFTCPYLHDAKIVQPPLMFCRGCSNTNGASCHTTKDSLITPVAGADGSLHLCTPVDPLFILLPVLEANSRMVRPCLQQLVCLVPSLGIQPAAAQRLPDHILTQILLYNISD